MERLTWHELKALQEVIRGSYAALDLKGFQSYVLSALPQVIRTERISYNEINPLARRNCMQAMPALEFPNAHVIFNQHLGEHPLIHYYERTGDTRPLKISDFLSQRQFHRLGLYCEFFRRVGVEHQLAVTLPAQSPVVLGIALSRESRDFSDRDRVMLHVLRPHLVQAYQNAVMVSGLRQALVAACNALDELDGGMVLLDRAGRVLALTRRSAELLRQYFGESHADGQLPDVLARWIRHHEAQLDTPDLANNPRMPFVAERAGTTLVVRLMTGAEQSVLILKEQVWEFPPESLITFGLTAREAEVLGLVIKGKTNGEIGALLHTSRHTIANHLQHTYEKLGVVTRTAAATRALELIMASRANTTKHADN